MLTFAISAVVWSGSSSGRDGALPGLPTPTMRLLWLLAELVSMILAADA